MGIAPTAGAINNSINSQVTSSTITVPSGILGGDVVFVWASVVPISASTATITASSTGTTPVAVPSGSVSGSEPLPATVTCTLFSFTAAGATGSASSDVGKVITLTYSVAGFPATALQGYSGANTTGPVDVINGAFGGANTATVTCPTLSTGVAGDWAVFFGGGAAEGANLNVPAGSTSRQSGISGSDLAAVIADSNAAVGGSGTSIGGGTFLTNVGTNSILVAVTVGLQAAGAGGSGASGSAMPPIIPPHPQFTRMLLEEAWSRADWQAQGVADLTVAFSSSSGGVDTYNVTSPYNGTGTHPMRVLKPTAPNTNYPHSFLIMLPVEPDQGTVFGDSIATAQAIAAQNAWNLTIVQPGYAGVGSEGPWYSDNPLDPTIYQETFTLKILDWIEKNLATTGIERTYLIGFSRSGLGGQGLQFRHPYLFAATASWDFPGMMTDYDGTDPTFGGMVGGNPAGSYGTSSNFTTKYQLSAAHLGFWQATGQYGTNRIWIGQGPSFPDTPVYDTVLTAAGIPHTYTFSNTVESHAWHTDWVAAALQAIIPSNEPTVLPQQIASHPRYRQLIEAAERRMTTGITAIGPVSGVHASLDFAAPAGTVSAGVTLTGAAAGLTLGAPAGSVAAGAVITGTPATLALAVPSDESVTSGTTIPGAVAPLSLAAPAGSVSAGAVITGAVSALALAAPAGSVSTGAGPAGIAAPLSLAAPAGSVSAGATIAGAAAALTLTAPPGAAAPPGTASPGVVLVFFP